MKKRYTIPELAQMRESEDHVEFKKGEGGNVSYNGKGKDKPNERRRCILGYVAALCNEGGGRIVIGMHDMCPHAVTGTTQCENGLGQLESDIYRDMGIRPDVYELFEEGTGKRVLVIEVPGHPIGKVFKFEDVALMRVGEELKPMSDAMYLKILQESEPDFSEKICEGLTVEDLDTIAIDKMKQEYANKWHKPEFAKLPTSQVLSDFKLIDREGRLNYAALILVGKEEAIHKYLPCNNVIVEYRLFHSMIEYTARKEFTGPLFLIVDEVWNYINQPASNPLLHYRDKMNIYDIPAFNEVVIREAILNAICHRVMYIQSDVVIKQYPDMLIITNAGGFPFGVDIDNILKVNSMPRSKRISEVLQKTGLVEKSGQGVDKMFYHCLMEGKGLPDYSGTDNFQVSLKLSGTIENRAFLLFVKHIQDERQDSDKLNVFDLLALYKASKKENLRVVDRETLNKLLQEGLLIDTEDGYKLPKEYDELSVTCREDVGNDVGDVDNIQLSERQQSIYNLIKENGDVTAKSLSETLSGTMSVTPRTIERDIRFLRDNGFIRKEGKKNKGIWIVLK